MELFLLFSVLFLVLCSEFINGWTDAPHSIATVVSTRSLSPKVAVLFAAVLNVAGVFAGTAVAETIAKDIVKPEAINLSTISAAMMGIILWGVFTWRYGLPTSQTHALVAGLSGAGLATAGPSVLIWDGWEKVILGLFISNIFGFVGGWFIAKTIRFICPEQHPSTSRKMFGKWQIISSGFMAFSHGSNDGQKFIGVFSLTLLLGGVNQEFQIPFWVILLCSMVMGLGTSIGGMRIIKTMGFRMVHLETYQGFAAETASASTILMASHLGIPLSTTHTISSAIMGVGTAKRAKMVHWHVVSHIVYAWLLTFPMCGLIAYTSMLIFTAFGIAGLLIILGLFSIAVAVNEFLARRKRRMDKVDFLD